MVKKIVSILLLLLLILPIFPTIPSFPTKTNPDVIVYPGSTPRFAALGDVNKDGRNDLLISNYSSNISVFYQKNDATFSSTPDKLLEIRYPERLIYINHPEADSRTHKWCIVASTGTQSISIFYNNIQGLLSSKPDVTIKTGTQCFAEGIAVGYFNGDSNIDIVVGCSESYSLKNSTLKFFYGPFYNDQTPNVIIDLKTKIYPESIQIGSFNGDSLDDIAITFSDSNQTYLFYQNNECSFSSTPNAILKTSATTQRAMAVGDLNRDGKDDVAISQYPARVSVFYQEGVGVFPSTPSTMLTIPDQYANDVCIADINNDYRKDVVVATSSGTRIFKQRTDGTLPTTFDIVLRDSGSTTWNNNHVVAGLINGTIVNGINQDQLYDLLITSMDNKKAYVWYQESPTLNLFIPDVMIDSGYPTSLLFNQTVNITAIISNSGTNDTSNVVVHFYENTTQIGTQPILSLKNRSSITVWCHWTCKIKGDREIKVTIDPKQDESTTDDNWNAWYVTVKTPDLIPLPPVVQGKNGGGATITSTIQNIGDGLAHRGVEVRFYSQNPGSNPNNFFISKTNTADSINPNGYSTKVSVIWPNPQGDTTVWVWVDPFHNLTEEIITANNKNHSYIGTQPSITSIRPYYENFFIDAEQMFVFSNRNTPLDYRIELFDWSSQINYTVFNMTGPNGFYRTFTDRDGNYAWNWSVDLVGEAQGSYHLTAQMYDIHGVASNLAFYNITVFTFPTWMTTLSLEKGPLTVKVSTDGVISFKISSDGWDFFKKSDNSSGSGDDSLTDGETKTETSTEFTIEFTTNWNDQTHRFTGQVEGKAGGETKSLGKSQKFGIEAEGGFTATVGIVPSPLQLSLDEAHVSFTLTITFKHLYGIAIPVINKGVGIEISAQPSLNVNYGFHTDNKTVINDNLQLTFGCRLEGGLCIDVYLGGARVYGYAEPKLKGCIGAGCEHPFSIEVGVGAGGSAWAGPFKWEGEVEGFHWEWPSERNVSIGNWTLGLRPMFGSNTTVHQNNLLNQLISNDLYFDDYPCTATDYSGNTFALWVRNTTIPDENQLMYAINNGVNWTLPQKLNDTTHMLSYPVIVFDTVNNTGVAAWVHNKAAITRNSSYQTFMTSYKDNEIYYALYNSSNQSWGAPRALTNNTNADTFPAIAADSAGNIMLVWVNDTDGNLSTPTDSDLYYAVWNTHTKQWSNPAPLPQVVGPPEMDTKPAVAYDPTNGQATVVWVHDEDSTQSTFDDHPPRIAQLSAQPNPAQQGDNIKISAKIYDELVETTVNSNTNYPDHTILQTEMNFNATSGFYEGTFQATQNGNYSINVTAQDYYHHLQHASIPVYVGMGDTPPQISNPLCNKSYAHVNDEIVLSAYVTDNVNVQKVWANITTPVIQSIVLLDSDLDNNYTGIFVPTVPGEYTIVIQANDSADHLSSARTFCTVVGPIDIEIYNSTYNPITQQWSTPQNITNLYDYQESDNPTVVYDLNQTAIIAWEEKIGDPQSFIYTSFLRAFDPLCDCRAPKQAMNIEYGNNEPKLVRSNNNLILLAWKADNGDTIWPELFYSVMDSTQLVRAPGGYRCSPLWGAPYQLTYNEITDWKPSVTIDPYTNKVSAVWLGHATMINSIYPTINLTDDDDDVFFSQFEFPIRMEGLHEIIRFSDGTLRKTLVFDETMHNQTVSIDIPVFTYPHYDARMKLIGVANPIGKTPTNVSIDLGSDGHTDLFFSSLNDTRTYYLNAVDEYAAFDSYLQNHWIHEEADGKADARVTVPITIHSDTPGIIQLSDISIGFDFTNTQRDCDQPFSIQGIPTIVGLYDQNHPDLYSSLLAYENHTASQSNIHVFNLSSHLMTTVIAPPGNQTVPKIYGKWVVYQDYRNPTFGYDVYYYDMNQHIERRIVVGPTSANQMLPDISGDNIVYQDNRYGVNSIFMYNTTTYAETPIYIDTTPPFDNRNPTISGRYILWQHYSGSQWQIYYADLNTRAVGPLTRSSNDQTNPDVEGMLTVYQDNSSGNWNVYLYNFTSGMETVLTTSPYQDINPAVSAEGRVIWERQGPHDSDIYLWDSTLNEEILITANTSNQITPCIYSDYLGWTDTRFGTQDIFTATVQLKHVPFLEHIPDIIVNETDLAYLIVNGVDPDGDTIVYTINDSRFSQDHNLFTWQTQDSDKGTSQVVITVSDCCHNISQTINVTVLDDNKPPVLYPINDITIKENEIVQFTAFASDVNNDFLFFAINSTRFSKNVNVFTWQTDEGDAGTYHFMVNVSDDTYVVNQSITVHVNFNRPTYNITTLSDGSLKKNLTFASDGNITDYVSVPQNATVISATMNITGYPLIQNQVFFDNFNDGDLAGWTISTQGSGIIQISDAQYHSAPYSMRMYSPSGTSSLAMATNSFLFNPVTTDYNVSFYFRLTSTTNHWFDVFANIPQILTVIDTGNVFTYRYSSTNVAIMTFNINQWYHIEYITHVTQGNYEIIVDGVYKATAPFCGGGGNPQTFTIGDFESGSSNYGEAFWDDFIILSLLMRDDFNDNNLNGWTVTTTGGGLVQTTATQYHTAPYSMRMYSPTSPAIAKATYTMSTLNITRDYNVTLYFRMPTTTHHWFDVFTNPPHTTTVIDTSYGFTYRYGTTNVWIMAFTPNVWYRIDYYVHPSQSNYDIYVNNVYKATAPFNGEAGNPQTFRIGDFESGSSNYGEGFWDDFTATQIAPNSYPSNPWLDVGNDGDHEWNYAGNYSTKEVIPDFSSEINQYLATQPPGGNVLVPFVFHSDNAGTIEISGIRITYVLPAVNHPPHQPNDPSPANLSTNIPLSADISWSCSDPDQGDTLTYDVYFGTTRTPLKVSSNQTSQSYDPGILTLSTTYYWRIIAWDDHQAYTIGPLWNFTTRSNNPPTPPSNPNPTNTSTGVSVNANLSWSASTDPNGDTIKYDVYFGSSPTPLKVSSNQSDITYDLPTLTYNTHYYWRIVAWDYYNASTQGPCWEFTTEQQEFLLDGYCYYTNMSAVNPVTVNITNLNTGRRWLASTNNYYYSLNLIIGHDVNATETLRYIARDTNESVNVSDHVVTSGEITAGTIHLDLILTVHYRDLKSFPFYVSQVDTGAMVMKMMMDYLMWNSTLNPQGPPSYYNEQTMYNNYSGGNYINGSEITSGLNSEVDDYHHGWIYGYFFAPFASTDENDVLKHICIWLDYPVNYYNDIRDVDVPKPGHPNHVPIAIPCYGNYNNWMVVRGIHTDKNAWLPPEQLTVYGFWLNDPKAGGLGTNTYVTISRFLSTYFLNLSVPGDVYNGKRLAITDPYADFDQTLLSTIQINSKPLNSPLTLDEKNTIQNIQGAKGLKENSINIIIKAARQGVNNVLRYDTIENQETFNQAHVDEKPILKEKCWTVKFTNTVKHTSVDVWLDQEGRLLEFQIRPQTPSPQAVTLGQINLPFLSFFF